MSDEKPVSTDGDTPEEQPSSEVVEDALAVEESPTGQEQEQEQQPNPEPEQKQEEPQDASDIAKEENAETSEEKGDSEDSPVPSAEDVVSEGKVNPWLYA